MEPSQPASHSQCVTEVEAVGPCELAGQASQAAEDDGAALYCAVVHADTLGPDPVYPASARHADSAAVAGFLEEEGLQVREVAVPEAVLRVPEARGGLRTRMQLHHVQEL